jgi:hypothetical protein
MGMRLGAASRKGRTLAINQTLENAAFFAE